MIENKNFKRLITYVITTVLCLTGLIILPSTSAASTTFHFGSITLTDSSGSTDSGHFSPVFDLTKGDMVLNFTYDGNGLNDSGSCHAWAELGVREVGYSDFNPTWNIEGAGVWLATDYDWNVDTFDPDTLTYYGSPFNDWYGVLDLDDKLILQKGGGCGEGGYWNGSNWVGGYNLPSIPPTPGNNHRVWWDRDGVDPWQNNETANTGGSYDIEISLHATDATSGTAYMKINGLYQGFETDSDWSTIELTPAGMTFTGDMKQMQVFYGIYGYGATHSIEFNNIVVTGYPACVFEAWVDDDWSSNTPGDIVDTHVFGYDAFSSVQDGITAVCNGGIVYVADGLYSEGPQIHIDKNVTIIGDGCGSTIITPTSNTGSSGDSRGWFLVDSDVDFHLSGVELNGIGYNIYQGIRHKGTGTIDNVCFTEIKYPTYGGVAIAAFASTGSVNITNCDFSEIGRVGILMWMDSNISGNTYVGKGDGDWLDYFVDTEIGTVFIENNDISGCTGVASSDGSTSAGILVTTYYYPGADVTINKNLITGNTVGVHVGYDSYDTSSVIAHCNRIYDNTDYGVYSTAPIVDALYNWWGDNSGPYHDTLNPEGIGNAINENVTYNPWAGQFFPDTTEPIQVGNTVTMTGYFTCDMDSAEINWGDDNIESESLSEVTSLSQSHEYTTPGVYTVTLQTTDNDDSWDITMTYQYVVVYDPSAGFVTGGGWINSPEGAYTANTSLEGKANFGFVSKYKKGEPVGKTEFQFKVADFNFHSDTYDWLVITNHKAMYKGTGTVNGSGNYGFLLSAIDADKTSSTEVDLFRIKIWDKDNDDEVVYDNMLGEDEDEDPTTEIGGGNIKIHKGN